MEIDCTAFSAWGDAEPVKWSCLCITEHGPYAGSGPTRYAAMLDAVAKAAEESPEAAYELRELVREGDPGNAKQ